MDNYGIDSIKHLDTRTAYRERIQMYLGSDDTEGIYQALKEIINNSTDEALAGYGNTITICVSEKNNRVIVTDEGRGVPFGIKDGRNILVSIYTESHTGGKFDKNAYKNSSGLNGIGGTAVCMSSKEFRVTSHRDGKQATASFEEGVLKNYEEIPNTLAGSGTTVEFIPDPAVFKLMTDKFSYDRICNEIKNISYLNKGIHFKVGSIDDGRTVEYFSENGIGDFIKDNVKKPLMSMPIISTAKDEIDEIEVAFMWTDGPGASYVFVNGLYCNEGGSPITGAKTTFTTSIKRLAKKEFDPEIIRKGLVYAINCKVANPSFANQTKSKINNPNLRTLASTAFKAGLDEFALRHSGEFNSIIEMMSKVQRAEKAAEKARQQVLDATKDIEKNQKRKVFASDKLKDAEFLGQDSILLIAEGDSALGSLSQARDYTKYGLLAIRGKMINALSNPEDKVFANEEIKLLLSAMNIIPGKYNSSKLRYGKIGVCTDADSDGYHIGLLIMANLWYLAPEFIKEGRLCWLRSPLYIVDNKGVENYYFTDEEYNKARGTIKGEVTRAKGLGELPPATAKKSMFSPEYQRLETIEYSDEGIELLQQLMGKEVAPRTDYIFKNVDFSEIKE